jgi:hypothetical protein
MVSAFLCDGRVTAPLGFWPFSDANCASRFSACCSLLAQGNPAVAAYAPRELDDHSFAPEDIAIARYRQRRVVLQSCEIFATLDKSFHSVTLQIRFSCSAVTKLQQMGVGNGEPLH